jgi:hypothetical protein
MLATVSKDLYVLKRAIEVYQKYIVERFTAQTTDYGELLKVGGSPVPSRVGRLTSANYLGSSPPAVALSVSQCL